MVIIIGPSASGKTDLAIKIAKKVGTNILSADSKQIYKNLDYSTGKLPLSYKYKKQDGFWNIGGVKYFGYDIVNPDKKFSAGDFVDYANKIIELEAKKPIICGGTGLYLSALLGNTALNKTPKNALLRKKLEVNSAEKLLQILTNLNYNTTDLNNSEKHNKQRLIRKIEIEQFKKENTNKRLCLNKVVPNKIIGLGNYVIVGLNVGNYDKKIENWVNENFKNIENEVSWLNKKYPKSLVFTGFIFSEMKRYINNEIDKKEAKQLIYYSYRQYIKRQLTYFNKHFTNARWFLNQKDAKKYILSLF